MRDPCSPINAGFLQRTRLHFLRYLPRPRKQPAAPGVAFLPFGFVLKYGKLISLSEAHTIKHVSYNTKVPVPRIVTAYESKEGVRYILMTRIRGVPLSTTGSWSAEEEQKLLLQLREFVRELRALPPPEPNYVGGINSSPLHDDRVYDGPFGPFSSVAEFHKALRHGIGACCGHEKLKKIIEEVDSRDYTVHLTHGDLSFRNIILYKGEIAGIVDWETAGWFPDYWEYASAYYSFFDHTDMQARLGEFLDAYPDKTATEQARRRLFNNM